MTTIETIAIFWLSALTLSNGLQALWILRHSQEHGVAPERGGRDEVAH